MGNTQIFEGVDFLRDLSIMEFFMFFLYLAIIFGVKAILIFIMRSLSPTERFKERILPIIEDVLNWLALYGSILFFLFYFSQENWLFDPFYETEGVEVTVFLIVVVVLIVTFASRVVKAFNLHVMPIIYNQFDVDPGMGYTINRLIYYSVMFMALALSFTTVGLDLTAVGVVFSVLGIGIGFGVRNIAANFVAGIIILFERPMEVGQMVEIDNKIGRIKKIKLRSTVVETLREGTLVVPNQYFIEQIVRNRSSAELFARVIVSVAYGNDTEQVDRLLTQSALDAIRQIDSVPDDIPAVNFIAFRNSSLDFQVEVHVTNVEMKEQLENIIRHAITKRFLENDIKLAEVPMSRNE